MTWTSPFALPGRWFRGNLHTHTTQSDGEASPEEACRWYHEHGYDFLAITDHWVATRGQEALGGILTISGAEIHPSGWHILALGITSLPPGGEATAPAEMIKAVRAMGGLPYVAHPYWTRESSAEIAAVAEACGGALAGIEVFNAVCEYMDGLGYAHVHWDDLLARGHRLTGLAVDDTHWRNDSHGQGFVMVRAAELSERALLAAIAAGQFYSSTGPILQDLCVTTRLDGSPALRVLCSPCEAITFHTRGPLGHRFVAPAGESLQAAEWPLRREQVFVRVECRDSAGRIAWSNALMVEDVLGPA